MLSTPSFLTGEVFRVPMDAARLNELAQTVEAVRLEMELIMKTVETHAGEFEKIYEVQSKFETVQSQILEMYEAMQVEQENQNRRLTAAEQSFTKLENTIMTENRDTRDFMRSQMDKQWDLLKARDEQSHELKKSDKELSKVKTERGFDLGLKVIGGGSILWLLIESILK